MNALIEPTMGEKLTKGIGGGGETAWYSQPGGCELADHLAQRGVLAAHAPDVVHAECFEPKNIISHLLSPGRWPEPWRGSGDRLFRLTVPKG